MCGIVGGVAERHIVNILLEGLKRLEYRGYDSAGVALLENDGTLQREREVGKVQALSDAVAKSNVNGVVGIAHTRWATHGGVTQANAHPHMSGEEIALVHNGIIENHETLRIELQAKGYEFSSATDTEVIAHLVNENRKTSATLLEAVQTSVKDLEGAYGTVIMEPSNPDRIVVARSGSPLVIGLGIGENFVASDQLALLPVTRRFIFLEEGDVAEITRDEVNIYDAEGNAVVSLSGSEDYEAITPVYEEMPGWTETTLGAQSMDELPAAAVAYIKRLEELVGAPIDIISTGPDRVETIVLRHPFDA